MNEGWIKLHRQLKEWQHFQEPTVVLVWLDLLISANTKDGWYKGQRLRRGELFTSVATIQEHTGLDAKTIRKALDKLVATGEIKREATNEGSKITINQFVKYQGSGNNPQPTPQRIPQPTPEPNPQPTPQRLPYQQELYNNNNSRKQERESESNAPARIGVDYFGPFHNVELLPQERRTLVEQYGEALVAETIDALSCKLMDGNAQSNYHYATLQTWLKHSYKAEAPTPPQPAPYKPTPEEQQLNDLLEEWRTLPKDAYKGDNLEEMRKRHGQLPDEFLKSIGMCFFRGSWYWKS